MIDYKPFWETLAYSSESTYTLIHHYHISSATIDKLRHNRPITTTTLDDLCCILHCNINEIVRYTSEDNPYDTCCENGSELPERFPDQGVPLYPPPTNFLSHDLSHSVI